MGTMTGVLAGMATMVGALALYQFLSRRTGAFRDTLDRDRNAAGTASGAQGTLIEFERDPETGVFRPRG